MTHSILAVGHHFEAVSIFYLNVQATFSCEIQGFGKFTADSPDQEELSPGA